MEKELGNKLGKEIGNGLGDKEKQMQEMYMQLTMMNQQMTELQKQIQSLEESMVEVSESVNGIRELSKLDSDKEILVPIVSGIFAKAELKKTKEFIVNVGANTAVLKSSEEVTSLLDKQLNEMQTTQDNFVDNLQKLTVQAKEIEEELKASMGK